MRRNVHCLFVVLFLSTALTGCSMFTKKTPVVEASNMGTMDMYIPSMTGSTASYDGTQAYEPAAPIETFTPRMAVTTYDPLEPAVEQPYANSGERFHTVAPKETLYSLARQYYGDQRRWKDIYEANRTLVRNPNQIFIGQRLAIP